MKQIGLFRNENVLLPEPIISTESYAIFDGASWFDTGWAPSTSENITKIELCWYVSVDGKLAGDSYDNLSLYGSGGISNIWQAWISVRNFYYRFTSPNLQYYQISESDLLTGDKITATIERNGSNRTLNIYKNDSQTLISNTRTEIQYASADTTVWIGRTNPVGWEGPFIGNYSYAKFYSGDTLVHHYTFVEVGGVGKMKDEVTGTIFENQGTGSIEIVHL